MSRRYRRAEGLEILWSLCEARARVRPAHWRHEATLTRDEVRALVRLSQWLSADEVGLAPARLAEWVAAELVYFSDGATPRHVLPGAVADGEHETALAANVEVNPLVWRQGELDGIAFMPRLGELDGAELHGFELRTYAWDHRVTTTRLACCARHGAALRRLWPRLDGTHSRAALVGDDEAACAALSALGDLGVLESHTAPPPAPAAGVRLTWLGHAHVLVEAGGVRLLVDPLMHTAQQPARAGQQQPPDWRDLGRLDAILVTHGDNDHLNPQSLSRLDPATPVFIPRAPARRAYQVDVEAMLALLGFGDVRALAPWQATPLGALELLAAPFVGEDWGLELPQCTWLVRAPGGTVYLSADAGAMPDVCRQLAARGPIDFALLGVSGCAEPHVAPQGFGYGHFYEGWIAPERRQEWIALTAGPHESAEAARLLGARRVFGYAAGGTGYAEVSWSDRGTHAELAALLAGSDCEPVELTLGVPYTLRR